MRKCPGIGIHVQTIALVCRVCLLALCPTKLCISVRAEAPG